MDLADIFEDLIRAQKRIAGMPDWHPGPRSGQQRWLASLSITGVVCDLALVIDAFPREPSPKFSMALICGASLVRLDYGELEMHFNHPVAGFAVPSNVPRGWIEGPHIHSWSDNKRLIKDEPPKELEFAVPLPLHIQGFANCYRWFCGEYNIDISGLRLPEIPAKDMLF